MPVIKRQDQEGAAAAPPEQARNKETYDKSDVERILNIEMRGAVVLARKEMHVSDILGVKHGVVIEFEKSVREPLTLEVNNKVVALGKTVKIGEKFGLQVTEVVPVDSKLAAMADVRSAPPMPPMPDIDFPSEEKSGSP